MLLRFQRVNLLFLFADAGDGVLLHLPARLAGVRLLAQPGELLIELPEPLARMRVVLLEQRLALDLQLQNAPFDLIDLHGKRIELHAQSRRRFIDQIDGLIGQKPVGDVAV